MTAGHWDMTLADALRARAASVTDTAGCDLNARLSISEENRRVPRGVHIENICGISWREHD